MSFEADGFKGPGCDVASANRPGKWSHSPDSTGPQYEAMDGLLWGWCVYCKRLIVRDYQADPSELRAQWHVPDYIIDEEEL